MLKKLLALSVVTLFPLTHLFAEIIESDKISEIQNFAYKNSLVFLNVTDTIYAPINTLSDNQWRIYFTNRVNNLVMDEKKAATLINQVKSDIVNHIPKKLVEPDAPAIISKLQEEQIPVFAITKKKIKTPFAENFGLITSDHIRSLGIDLEKSKMLISATDFEKEDYSFCYGILFTNAQNEGPIVLDFLNQISAKPTNIVVVDNSLHSLERIEKAVEASGIKFHGYHYTLSNDRKANFDVTLGTIQFFEFIKDQTLISDEEALIIKQKNAGTDYEDLLNQYILEKSL